MGPSHLPERLALVLGGGGLKGFAHIGVLRALVERGIQPEVVAGTSIGSLIAAAYVTGMSLDEMEARAVALRQRDLFRIDHIGMVSRRMRNASLYLEEPLRRLVNDIVPDVTFTDLDRRLLVATTDLERGGQLIWGLPGLDATRVREAVYASCALPGFFPPARIEGRLCVDGSVMDNLPVAIAAPDMGAVLAVDVGTTSMTLSRRLDRKGFAATYMRSAQIMMHALEQEQLQIWGRPPMLLMRPAVWHFPWFTFRRTKEIIAAGYAAASDTLDRIGDALLHGRGVYPRRTVELHVDRPSCIGCTLCVTLAPHLLRMDEEGKAEVRESPLEWSRADGDFVHQCPTEAIHVTVIEGDVRRPSVQIELIDE
jgi:NTE family protein